MILFFKQAQKGKKKKTPEVNFRTIEASYRDALSQKFPLGLTFPHF